MTIKNFEQFLVEEEREVFFTFGRMNPPTIGHGKVMDTLAKKSGKADYKVYLSQTQKVPKDPLSYSDKVKHVRKMFPKHARNVMIDKNVKTAINALVSLYDQGYRKVTMIVGDDRISEFEALMKKYNGVKARHGFYNFQSINIVSAGKRDPNATGVEGMSASKQRENAKNNDFVAFSQGVPKTMSDKDARKLFNDVRKGMGLSEQNTFANHIDLGKLTDIRERYVKGNLFTIGDMVMVKESKDPAKITVRGANYVMVEMSDGTKKRKWLEDIKLVEEKNEFDPHVMVDPRTNKKYNVDSPSQHKKFLKLGFESVDLQDQVDPVKKVKTAIDREKEADKAKHDRLMDRARLAKTRRINRT